MESMKPDWKDAPEWANYLAQDPFGRWFWIYDAHFFNLIKQFDYGFENEAALASPNWKDTLEERPK